MPHYVLKTFLIGKSSEFCVYVRIMSMSAKNASDYDTCSLSLTDIPDPKILTINKDNGDVGHNEDIAGTQHVLPNTLFNSAYKRPSLCKGKEK